MPQAAYVVLESRGVVRVAGADARSFLQGLVSNDVDRVGPERAIYAAMLTPQGKYLFDFMIAECGGDLLCDVERNRAADFLKRLAIYRLRSKVRLEDASQDLVVVALMGEDALARLGLPCRRGQARALGQGIVFTDPRLDRLGARAIMPRPAGFADLEHLGFQCGTSDDYDRLRLGLGVPDGSRDIVVEKTFLLEGNVEELGGIDFDKGCYVGQELTARSKFRGVVRKRLYRVDIAGPLPAPDTPILLGDREAGVMRSGRDGVGIALLRLELVAEAQAKGIPLTAGSARITPVKPDWVNF